jgi:hypothetical protein
VTPDGLVIMEVDVEKSRLGDANDSVSINGNQIRNINNVTASTTVSARTGQTIVFAGLIETTKETTVRGIPFISDIPVVGRLFEYESNRDLRRELLVILTPHVIRGENDIDPVRLAESERMSWCLADVMSLYGDVGLSARPGDWCDCRTEVPCIFPDANPTGIESVPAPMPAAGYEPGSVLPAPGQPGTGQMRAIEPTAPAGSAVTPPAEPVSNMSYQTPSSGGPYPGAVLRFDGANQMPQAPPAGPYVPGSQQPAAGDPYTTARRLPQGP